MSSRARPCCVPGCDNRKAKRHTITTKAKSRDIWLQRINNEKLLNLDEQQLKSYRICDVHFATVCKELGRLKNRALPTLYLPDYVPVENDDFLPPSPEAEMFKVSTPEKLKGVIQVSESSASQIESGPIGSVKKPRRVYGKKRLPSFQDTLGCDSDIPLYKREALEEPSTCQYRPSTSAVLNLYKMVETTTTITRDAHYYDMDHKYQGFAYIFSNDVFPNSSKRNAADVDEKNLKNLLYNMKFDVRVFKNLKVSEIKHHIVEVRKKDHTNNNCFLLFVLSHGGENIIEALDGCYDPSEMFWNQFTAEKCPSLAGKPKLFFVQCCRGEKVDSGITLKYVPRTETDGHSVSYTIPNHSDFCIMYATCKDHFAFRNDKQGSYFVKFFCEELEKYAYSQHLLTILTFVIRRVAVEMVSKCREPQLDKKKQTPYFESSLTRLLLFKYKE